MTADNNLSNMFKLFAVAFRPPAAGPWAEAVVSGSLRDDMAATWEALDLVAEACSTFRTCMDGYVGRDADEVMHELRIEQTRLFIGENPPVENSEGTWLQRHNGVAKPIRMINNHTVAVTEFMKSCGVVRQLKYNDCIDYVENECDFCGHLATVPDELKERGIDPLEKLDEFMDQHMSRWIPGFCDEVISLTKTDYYRGVCTLLRAFVKEF
jgi:TorA maturation chaperone TorD